MSFTFHVLCPNGHRQTVKFTPNANLLKVLEEVCSKQGYSNSSDYQLRYRNKKVLDTSLTIRYSGLANNSKLELIKCENSRNENNVTVGLQTSDGQRILAEFLPTTSLWEMLQYYNKNENIELTIDGMHPVCLYMRSEVIGVVALEYTTLRSLGLTSGKASIRFFHRAVDESTLKSIESKIESEKKKSTIVITKENELKMSSKDKPFKVQAVEASEEDMEWANSMSSRGVWVCNVEGPGPRQDILPDPSDVSQPLPAYNQPQTQMPFKFPEETKGQNLYKNELSDVKIEEFRPCERNTVLFKPETHESMDTGKDVDDTFFQHTEKDLRSRMDSLKYQVKSMKDANLTTAALREAELEMKMSKYEYCIIRIHFTNNYVIQGCFRPKETVYNLQKFVEKILNVQDLPFYLYTTPPKKFLKDISETLYQAGLVPLSVVHFGCNTEQACYLSKDILDQLKTQEEADKIVEEMMYSSSILDDNNKLNSDDKNKVQNESKSTVSHQKAVTAPGKVPKWFKTGK